MAASFQGDIALPDSITSAQPPLTFIPPHFNPIVYRVGQVVLPFWMRWRVQLVEVKVNNPQQLVQLYQQFQAGQVRFMMAFRHPSADDPFGLFNLLSRQVPQAAQQQGIRFKQPIHAHFIYDRGIPLWAGRPIGWLISQLGGTPIRRGKVDIPALRSIRQLFTDGQFPMAAAPEGATNGHNELVSPIEPGIAQFGFWCVEDLQKAGRQETVLIVPIGIRYHYLTPPWNAIEQVLNQIEADCGLSPISQSDQDAAIASDLSRQYRRLLRLGEHLLSLMEQFYSKFYHQAVRAAAIATENEAATVNDQIAARLQRLLNAALTVAEQHFGIQPKGTVTDRCRRIEQVGWDWIFREDLDNVAQLPLTEKGLADRIAEEADLRLWHMRLVESFVSVTGHYILEKPSVDRMAETVLLLWDMVTRLKGDNPNPRPRLGQQQVEITIGEPISVSDRWSDYQASRRQATADLTQTLQTALEQMIH